jgi:hypothetical protein
VMPIRVPITVSTAAERASSLNGGPSSAKPSCAPPRSVEPA